MADRGEGGRGLLACMHACLTTPGEKKTRIVHAGSQMHRRIVWSHMLWGCDFVGWLRGADVY